MSIVDIPAKKDEILSAIMTRSSMSTVKTLAMLAEEASKNIEEVSCEELSVVKDKVTLIDVREKSEADAAMIPGAVHIARGVLEAKIAKVLFNGEISTQDLDSSLLLYCGGGHRSLLAAESLKKMGFKDVRSLNGGFKAWSEQDS